MCNLSFIIVVKSIIYSKVFQHFVICKIEYFLFIFPGQQYKFLIPLKCLSKSTYQIVHLYITFNKMVYRNKINCTKGNFSDFVALPDTKVTPNDSAISVTCPFTKCKISQRSVAKSTR